MEYEVHATIINAVKSESLSRAESGTYHADTEISLCEPPPPPSPPAAPLPFPVKSRRTCTIKRLSSWRRS